ncbi:MAG: hypothetical protein OEY52_03020 [Gammaproteobacteria bacterium]|nr:hypothetical protein [Gammaproteobacteria bacterium]
MKFYSMVILVSILALGSTQSAMAIEQSKTYGESTAGFLVGISSKTTTFTVGDKNNRELASFEGSEASPMIVFTTKDLMYGDWESWGLSVEFGYSQFDLNKQKDRDGTLKNFNTSVDGNYTYGMATFTLHSDDKRANRMDEEGFILGLNAGYSLLKASGSVVYTGTDYSRHNISTSSVGPTFGIYGEYRNSGFFVRLDIKAMGGEEDKADDPDAAGNIYVVGESSLNIGYSIYF